MMFEIQFLKRNVGWNIIGWQQDSCAKDKRDIIIFVQSQIIIDIEK